MFIRGTQLELGNLLTDVEESIIVDPAANISVEIKAVNPKNALAVDTSTTNSLTNTPRFSLDPIFSASFLA